MTDEELNQLVEAIRRKVPIRTSRDIEGFEEAHRIRLREEKALYVTRFEDFFDTLNGLVRGVNYVKKEGWSQSKTVHFLFYPEMLKTLHRAFEDVQDGHYDESVILQRCVYETVLRIVFLYKYPEAWESIFHNKPGQRAFKVSDIPREHGLDWEFIYRLMCVISHSKVFSTLSTLNSIAREGQKDILVLEYKYDEKYVGLPMNTSIFLLSALFHFFVVAFLDDLKGILPEGEYERTLKVDAALQGLVESNPRPKFSVLAADIRKLGAIVRGAA